MTESQGKILWLNSESGPYPGLPIPVFTCCTPAGEHNSHEGGPTNLLLLALAQGLNAAVPLYIT